MPPIIPAPTDIPDDEADNVFPANNENPVVALSDSDSMSDSENIDHNGYELLSQDPQNYYDLENDVEDCLSESDDDDSVIAKFNADMESISTSNLEGGSIIAELHVMDEDSCDFSFRKEISSAMFRMDAEHVETIKSVMKGITLPSSNLPQWANLVPEEEWKAALLSKMKATQTHSNISRGGRNCNSSSNNKFGVSNDVLR